MPARSYIRNILPLWLKIAYTAWMILWVPAYAGHYGPHNFLWLCDIANFIILIALWTESRLLLSSQLVAVLLVDLFWMVDLAIALIAGFHPIGGTEYMLDRTSPLFIRLLSLFHVFVPLLLLFAISRLGFHRKGLLLQTALTAIVLPLTYLLTDPEKNINWVFGPFGRMQETMDPLLYLLIAIIAYPLALYLPTQGVIVLLERRFLNRRLRQHAGP